MTNQESATQDLPLTEESLCNPLGNYSSKDDYEVDCRKVQIWTTRELAVQAAKAIRWPVNSVIKVNSRFWNGYALSGTTRRGLSPEGYEQLFKQWLPKDKRKTEGTIELNGKLFARGSSGMTENHVGFYRVNTKSIMIFQRDGEKIGAINAHGVLAAATRIDSGKYWYTHADLKIVGSFPSYLDKIRQVEESRKIAFKSTADSSCKAQMLIEATARS